MLQLLAGQGVTLETFVVPVGDPDMRLEWFLNKEPLLFKSSFTPVYDYGFVALSITKVAALTCVHAALHNEQYFRTPDCCLQGLPGRLRAGVRAGQQQARGGRHGVVAGRVPRRPGDL